MASKASIGGHPVHPMLLPFPLALWTSSFIADVLHLFINNPSLLLFAKIALAGGLIGGVAAAIPGIIDWLAIRDAEVKKVANWHARLNVIALIIFAASLYLRMNMGGAALVSRSMSVPFVLSLVGVILISISGWLGGDLAYKHGVGVRPQHDSPEEDAAKVRYD